MAKESTENGPRPGVCRGELEENLALWKTPGETVPAGGGRPAQAGSTASERRLIRWQGRPATVAGLLLLLVFLATLGAAQKIGVVIDKRDTSEMGSYALLFCWRQSPGRTGLPGHAFVVWVSEDPGRCFSSAEAFGLYPARDDALGIVKAVVASVPGKLRSELAEAGEIGDILEVRLSRDAYRRTEEVRRRWEAHNYQLGLSDCVTFLMEVARTAGLEVPPRWQASTPQAMVEQLVERNPSTAPRVPPSTPADRVQSSRQAAARTTMDRMKSLGLALESYRASHGRFPAEGAAEPGKPAPAVAPILDELQGMGVQNLSAVDGWGNPILWNANGDRYGVYSSGEDGRWEGKLEHLGPSESWDIDIMYVNGRFLTWPCDVPNPPDPDMPCFVMKAENATVLSIKRTFEIKTGNPEWTDLGAAAGHGVESLLTGFAQDLLINGAASGGPNPAMAGLTAVVTYLQRKADRLYDPVLVFALSKNFRLPKDLRHLVLTGGPGTSYILPVVVLDFLKVRRNGDPVDPKRYADDLAIWVRSAYGGSKKVDGRSLMSVDELRSLRGDRTYFVIPNIPFDARIWRSLCTKCRAADGTYSFVLGAGTRYGTIGRPGTIHEDEVRIALTGEATGYGPTVEQCMESLKGIAAGRARKVRGKDVNEIPENGDDVGSTQFFPSKCKNKPHSMVVETFSETRVGEIPNVYFLDCTSSSSLPRVREVWREEYLNVLPEASGFELRWGHRLAGDSECCFSVEVVRRYRVMGDNVRLDGIEVNPTEYTKLLPRWKTRLTAPETLHRVAGRYHWMTFSSNSLVEGGGEDTWAVRHGVPNGEVYHLLPNGGFYVTEREGEEPSKFGLWVIYDRGWQEDSPCCLALLFADYEHAEKDCLGMDVNGSTYFTEEGVDANGSWQIVEGDAVCVVLKKIE